MTNPQEVTAGGAPIVRTDVRPQADHSPPPVVTPTGAEAVVREGPVSAPASFRCGRLPHCAIYEAIHVEPPHHGVSRVTFHADLVGVYTWTDAAMVVHGLHAGAHLEANRWRWTYPAVEGEEV